MESDWSCGATRAQGGQMCHESFDEILSNFEGQLPQIPNDFKIHKDDTVS
jgi:hypothetical protein